MSRISLSTEKQSEWWEEDVRRLFHGVWAASPWNEDRMTNSAIKVLATIFAEAERRVIERVEGIINGRKIAFITHPQEVIWKNIFNSEMDNLISKLQELKK